MTQNLKLRLKTLPALILALGLCAFMGCSKKGESSEIENPSQARHDQDAPGNKPECRLVTAREDLVEHDLHQERNGCLRNAEEGHAHHTADEVGPHVRAEILQQKIG